MRRLNKALERAREGLGRLPESTRAFAVTGILGLAAAALAIAFLLCTNGLFSLVYGTLSSLSPPLFAAGSLVAIVLSSAAVGLLLERLSKEAAGSGMPQLKAAYWKDLGYVAIRPVLVKFLAGVVSIGGGASLGREGPTVYMSGGLASWLSGFLGYAKGQRRGPALVGASAGLAAAFNTPLAAITFALEEIVGDISGRSIGRVLLSSVIGAFAVHALIGAQPAFHVPPLEATSWAHYAVAPFVALVAAFLGVAFHVWTIALRARARRQAAVPPWAMPVVGGLATWAIGVGAYLATGRMGVFGLGYDDLSAVLRGDFVWWAAGILAACKLLATVASYASGGCGGIFSPLLFIGGLSGFFVAKLAAMILPLSSSDLIVLSIVGMGTCLGTVLKAPLSALLIVFEMTHQFALLPAMIIGTVVGMAASRLTGSGNFYDAILVQNGHELHKVRPPLDLHGWRMLPVKAVASMRPTIARSTDPAELKALLESSSYNYYPLIVSGEFVGMLSRKSIERAIAMGQSPEPLPAAACGPEEAIGDVADRFISSELGIMAVMGEGGLAGVLTLHDLLRAQASSSD
jgi:CIC family chloride channel protein